MSKTTNLMIARQLLDGMSSGRDPEQIAAMFAPDLVLEVPGDDGALPWIGRSTGREAMARFLRDQRALTEPGSFEVEDVLGSDARAVIVGHLKTRIKATDRVVAGSFAFILTIIDGLILRFQMLENSFAVSQAARIKRRLPHSRWKRGEWASAYEQSAAGRERLLLGHDQGCGLIGSR